MPMLRYENDRTTTSHMTQFYRLQIKYQRIYHIEIKLCTNSALIISQVKKLVVIGSYQKFNKIPNMIESFLFT